MKLRALRTLKREAKSAFTFVSERGAALPLACWNRMRVGLRFSPQTLLTLVSIASSADGADVIRLMRPCTRNSPNRGVVARLAQISKSVRA